MKKVEAYIRHGAFEQHRGSTMTVNVRPKLKLEVVIDDKDKPLVVETILKYAAEMPA